MKPDRTYLTINSLRDEGVPSPKRSAKWNSDGDAVPFRVNPQDEPSRRVMGDLEIGSSLETDRIRRTATPLEGAALSAPERCGHGAPPPHGETRRVFHGAVRVLCMTALALAGAGCGKNDAGAPPFEMIVNVKAAEAKVQPVEEKISLVASIYANEEIDVKSEIDGRIEQINFDEGQPLKKGQWLVKLDQHKLEAAVRQAEANFKLAEANRQRAEAMLNNKTISMQEFDQAISSFEANRATLELMQQQLKDSTVLAPFSGIAGARLVSPGQVINRDTRLTTLVDIDPVKIEFGVPERFIGQLRAGQTVEFRVAAYPGEVFQGGVYFIAPQVDLMTRTVLVKATQPNADGRLRPGMFGNLDLILRVKENAVMAPESSIIHEGDKTALFIIDADGRAQRVEVQLGLRTAGQVEIIEGLKGGEQVIYEGIQKVFPGMKVNTGDSPDGETSS